MKTKNYGSVVGLFLVSLTACFGQVVPPPNDDYTNRIILIGDDVSFTGTLAGATFESDQCEPWNYQIGAVAPTQSVWWEWTPTELTSAIIEVQGPSTNGTGLDEVEVWTIQGPGLYCGSQRQFVAGRVLSSNFFDMFVSFTAYPGTNYEIQLAGRDGASISMRLLATNSPYIITHPQTQTITVDDSALFTVIAAGQKPFTYQWQFNGTNLPGQTFPMLGLEQVTAEQAGVYQVWVTNAGGATLSKPASLVVTAQDTAPVLSVVQAANSNRFAFSLLGEVGRRYRIQSSTNLINWSAETSFPSRFYDPGSKSYFRSVVVNHTGSDTFDLPVAGTQKFFRATPFHAVDEACNNRIKQIRFAGLLLASDNGYAFTASYSWVDLAPYLSMPIPVLCPSGAHYDITAIEWDPTCMTGLHPFEEP